MSGEFSFDRLQYFHHAMPSSISILFILIMLTSTCAQHHGDHYLIRTMEKLPVHSEVINLRRLFYPGNQSEALNLDFSLAKRDEFPYMYFLINHSSRGILTIRKEIDRDELCRLRRCRCETWCDLELEILINGEQFNIELLTVRILDRNDHQPMFPTQKNPFNVTIVENAPIGAMIKLEPAIDQDQGHHGIVGYSLVSSRALPFSLRYDLIRSDLSLVIEQNLDRETISSYSFDIIARDGENQTGILHVNVNIDDINDSPPKFEQTIYTIRNVSENLPVNALIARVHAIDQDEGINGEIYYYLINDEQNFQIDQWTGEIRVQQALDYETKNLYRLEIEARDNGEGSKSDFCTVLIYLIDENDNAPIIDIYPNELFIPSNQVTLTLNESLPINSLVLSLSIVDRDAGDNGRVTWKLDRSSSSFPFELIRLTETTGELRTRQTLDREYISEYHLILEATDHGRPIAKSSRLNLSILISDENDNVPIFRQTNFNVSISEHVHVNHSNGYEIAQVQADDFDQGLNGQIIYSILNPQKNLFQIDPNTGTIRAMAEFDRDEQEIYVLQIEARDQGQPSLSSRTTVTLIIVPRNEFAPVCHINDDRSMWSIMENSAHGTTIGTILCSDEDQHEPNQLMTVQTYWFPDQNRTARNIPFDIKTIRNQTSKNQLLVTISVNGSVDREMLSFYSLQLVVSDHGNPSRSVNLSLSIEILDENDHCPQLHLDSTFFMINRDVSPHEHLIHLLATDHDQDRNGKITFELSPSTSPSFITLFPNGTLFVQTDSDLIEENTVMVLYVQIRDHGEPTPCRIVETLRFFFGSNQTDWKTVMKNNQPEHHRPETALRTSSEQYQQGKRMAHAYSIQSSSSMSSPLFQYSSALTSLSTRKQLLIVFVGSSILMFVVLSTMVICFIDCLHKRAKQSRQEKSQTLSMLPINGLNHHHSSSNSYINGKPLAMSSPVQSENYYDYRNYNSVLPLKPVVVMTSSNSHSLSSIDSMTRVNTAHNRTLTTKTYTYTALSTSEDLMPGEFDEAFNPMLDRNGVEFMMTTV